MFGRLLVASAATFLTVPAALHAQEARRFQVLILYFEPRRDADDDFGKDASKELRELIDGLPTHMAMSERDIRDEVRRFDTKIEDLDCTLARQLASQINVPAPCRSRSRP